MDTLPIVQSKAIGLKKISEIVEMQIKAREESGSLMHKLEQRIGTIQPKPSARPFEDFEKISAKLSENVIKLTRIGEAEEKLEHEVGEEKTDIGKIEAQLKILEDRFDKLKKAKGTKKGFSKKENNIGAFRENRQNKGNGGRPEKIRCHGRARKA